MIGFAVEVGAQSARAGIPEHIQEALARSGLTRHGTVERIGGAPVPREGDPLVAEPVVVGGDGP